MFGYTVNILRRNMQKRLDYEKHEYFFYVFFSASFCPDLLFIGPQDLDTAGAGLL